SRGRPHRDGGRTCARGDGPRRRPRSRATARVFRPRENPLRGTLLPPRHRRRTRLTFDTEDATTMPHRVEIPADELEFTFSRSSGKGGQNVIKVSTRVTLRWEFGSSRALRESQKRRIASSPLLARRTVDGAIVLHEDRERQQGLNRKLV